MRTKKDRKGWDGTLGGWVLRAGYALSKVLEECMLEQYYAQYDLNGCCLMAP
jgi:nucleoside-diphosphate-sugar epimerase